MKQAEYQIIDGKNELGSPPDVTLHHPETDRRFDPAVVENDNVLMINGIEIPPTP